MQEAVYSPLQPLLHPLPDAADLSCWTSAPGHLVFATRTGRLYAASGALAVAAFLAELPRPPSALLLTPPPEERLLALQADGGVAAWRWLAGGAEWRAQPGAGYLALPPVAGHSGAVRSACLCVHPPPGGATELLWLLHSASEGRTHLLLRLLPPSGARSSASVVRLGSYADGRALASAGGPEAWVCCAGGAVFRWCLAQRRCLARVALAASPLPTLQWPSRELLGLSPAGALTAVGDRKSVV